MPRIVLNSVIWGFSFLFIKVAVEGFTPPTVAFLRISLGAVLVGVVLRLRSTPVPRDPMLWKHFIVTGLFGSTLPFTALAWGEQRITSALASVLNATTPLFTLMFAVLLTRDRFSRAQLVGLVAGFAGVSVAAGLGTEDLTGSALTGTVVAGSAGACYGLAMVWVRRHLGGVEALVGAFGQLVVGALLALPAAAATSYSSGIQVTPTRAGAVLMLGIFGTGTAMAVHYTVVRDLGPTVASIVTYLVPIVAITAGAVLLDEVITLRLVVGAVVVVASVAAINLGGRTREAAAPAAASALAAVADPSDPVPPDARHT